LPVFNEYLAQGHGWLFFPMAIFLGALHGLEPGHSKTMMAAFIVAIRGTIWQAILLGVSATISHTVIIWILAFIGLHYAENLKVEELEPYFQVATGIVIIGLAAWMLYKIRQAQSPHRHEHELGDAHERFHAAEIQKQLTGQQVTTKQIILFGLTGGLLPCPSAFAVLLVCLHLKKVALGFAMVLGFSLGLAITLVTVGMLAAVSVNHASTRFKSFGELASKVPYASSIILIAIGLLITGQGIKHLMKV
jgi:nickel/cobalt transporter (NicO) family protein